jgi:hypothetical protein
MKTCKQHNSEKGRGRISVEFKDTSNMTEGDNALKEFTIKCDKAEMAFCFSQTEMITLS